MFSIIIRQYFTLKKSDTKINNDNSKPYTSNTNKEMEYTVICEVWECYCTVSLTEKHGAKKK